ncbi:Citrate lyase subunit beta-like protein, mitochondrial isoform X1 [Oopsacas minuta]|uniref:Citrate lyase subunit beta-like protein, mitochondrial isoform X1 n=1 Tax=Oopsacas minuta TaxID=111878 RepID=A0AAV7JUJ3_9METZ|nr:Citrate lyase subunit beta-like protein, mitochondrial isoform X1 [Oopsacas minuta]
MLSISRLIKYIQFYQIGSNSFSSTFPKQSSTQLRPRRTLLYVPGDSERKVTKVLGLNADCVCLDIEDGVALSRKAVARKLIPDFLEKHKHKCKYEVAVRVNSYESQLVEEDTRNILNGKILPDSLVLPKIESKDELTKFSELIREIKGEHFCIPIMILIESPIGLINIREIFETASRLTTSIQLTGVIFGSDDYLARLGAVRTESRNELIYARQHIVTYAAAFGLQAIDIVHIDYKDLQSLRVEGREGVEMGYSGKQIIHPTQIEVVHEVFAPSEKEIVWAKSLMGAYEEHEKSGKGAFTFEGRMIDRPLFLQAQNVIAKTIH